MLEASVDGGSGGFTKYMSAAPRSSQGTIRKSFDGQRGTKRRGSDMGRGGTYSPPRGVFRDFGCTVPLISLVLLTLKEDSYKRNTFDPSSRPLGVATKKNEF